MRINDAGLRRFLNHRTSGAARTDFDESELSQVTRIQWCDWDLGGVGAAFKPLSSLSQIHLFPNLNHLMVQGNRVSDPSPVSGLEHLEELWLCDNNLQHARITDLPRLKKLFIDGNRSLEDLTGLERLPVLKEIDLNTTKITDYSPLLKFPSLTLVRASIAVDDAAAMETMVELRRRHVRVDVGRDAHRAIEDQLAKDAVIDADDPMASRLAELGLHQIAALWARQGPLGTDVSSQTPLHLLFDLPADRLGDERDERDAVLIELTRKMLSAGVDPHVRRASLYQETALTMVLRENENLAPLEVVDLLVGAQKDWSIPYRYGAPLAVVYENMGRVTSPEHQEWLEQCEQRLAVHDAALSAGTAFSMMCRRGTLAMIRLAIEKGADVDGVDCEETPLVAAVQADRIDVVRLLLEHGANVSKPDYGSQLAPVHAVRSVELLDLLVEHGADVRQRNSRGALPLSHLAATMRDVHDPVPVIRRLVELGNDPREAVPLLIDTCLMMRINKTDELTDYLEASPFEFDLNWLSSQTTLFEDLAWQMSAHRKQEFARRFKDPFGLKAAKTQTHFKQLHKYLDKMDALVPGELPWRAAVKLLCRSGFGHDKKGVVVAANEALRVRADVAIGERFAEGDSVGAMLGALPKSDPARVASMLWASGPDTRDEWGCSALHYIVGQGGQWPADQTDAWEAAEPSLRIAIAHEMLAAGASPEAHTCDGHTPISVALGAGGLLHTQMDMELARKLATPAAAREAGGPLKHLLEKLESESAEAHDGLIALLVERGAPHTTSAFVGLCGAGATDAVRRALGAGASANSLGVQTTTPLAAAVRGGHIDVVSLLLRHGADPNQRPETPYYGTPLAWSVYGDITELLIKHGADARSPLSALDAQTPAHVVAARIRSLPEDATALAALAALLYAGADFYAQDSKEMTVIDLLNRAIESGGGPAGLAEFVVALPPKSSPPC